MIINLIYQIIYTIFIYLLFCRFLININRLKINNRNIYVLLFSSILFLENVVSDINILSPIRISVYHNLMSSIFILTYFKNMNSGKLIVLYCVISLFLNDYYIISLNYLITIFIFLNFSFLLSRKSSKENFQHYIFLSIACFLHCSLLQITLMSTGYIWIKSKYLIYFAIYDLFIFTTTLILIHGNFRRLFID